MMATRLSKLGILLVAMMLVAASCGAADEEEGEPSATGGDVSFELRLGTLLPFTGDLSPFGAPADEAARLAIEEIQAAIEEVDLDVTAEIVANEDTQTDSKAAVEAANKLASANDVQAIDGAMASSSTIPVAESVTIPNEILQVSPASTSPAISELDDNGFVWRTAPSDALQGQVLAQAVADAFGTDVTINTGTRNDAYGVALIDEFVDSWESEGGEIGEQIRWNPNAPTFESEAQQLVQGDPDGWVIIDFPETWAKFAPALVRTGDWDPARTFTADGLKSETLPEDVGMEGTVGMRGTAPTAKDSPAAEAFDDLWQEKADIDRETFDAHSFDAVILPFLAAIAAGSGDPADMAEEMQGISGPPGTEYTFEELPQAIESLIAGEDIDYQGAAGPIDFDDQGDPSAANYEVWEFDGDGKIATLEVVPFEAD